MADTITVSREHLEQAFVHERDVARAQDEFHVAENALNRYITHLRALYDVPTDYVLRDWMIGFEVDDGDDDS